MLRVIKKRFRSYSGRHYMSRWARVWFRTAKRVQRIIGVNLAVAVLAIGVVEPNAHGLIGRSQLENIPVNPYIMDADVETETTLAWPVIAPSITQGYRYGHPGLDMQSAKSRSVYPIDEGWIADVVYSDWGYGNHIYIHHPNGRTSLYAHFDTIAVVKGQTITRETVLGQMGQTGWASGIHLHLEIYEEGAPVNPFGLLPDLTTLATN